MSIDLRHYWETTGTKRLDLVSVSDADIDADEEQQIQNLLSRMDDLASVLHGVYIIYHNKPSMYGERLLAFVGNSIVREWPYKDPIFTSESAFKIIDDAGCYRQFMELPADVVRKKYNLVSSQLKFEHWTPISFFRDIFRHKETLSVEDFSKALKQNYRTVWVTKEEDQRLDKKTRSFRKVEDYANKGIRIKEKKRWDKLMALTVD